MKRHQKRILVIENDVKWRETLKWELSRGSFDIHEAAGYGQAISRLNSYAYDLLTVDLSLPNAGKVEPNEEGLKLLNRINDLNKSTPIIVMTGIKDEKNIYRKYLRFPIRACFSKGDYDGRSFYNEVVSVTESFDNPNKKSETESTYIASRTKSVPPRTREATKKSNGRKVERQLQVFLCHSSNDKPKVRKLFVQLKKEGWIDPWLDEKKIIPGEDWEQEIRKAVKVSDAVILCFSQSTIDKEGFIQKEIKIVLDVANEKSPQTIFLIPIKFENCTVPNPFDTLEWLDFSKKGSYNKLKQSLIKRANTLKIKTEP